MWFDDHVGPHVAFPRVHPGTSLSNHTPDIDDTSLRIETVEALGQIPVEALGR